MKLTNLWVKSPQLRVYHIVMRHKATGMQETIKTKAKSRKDAMDFGPKYMGNQYEIVSCKLYSYDPEVMRIKRKYIKPNSAFLNKVKQERRLAKLAKSK